MNLRRVTRMLSEVLAMSSSHAIGFVARARAEPFSRRTPRLAQNRARLYVRSLCSIIERRFAL
jgi:hypothetical protein